MSMYIFQEFPKWKYAHLDAVVVEDADAEAALGSGWYNTPEEVAQGDDAQAAAAQALADQAAQDLLTLRATAKDLGITVDGRWNASRLETEIKAKIEATQTPDPLV